MYLNQRGITSIVILMTLLFISLGATFYLVNKGGPLKLFPKATAPKDKFMIGMNTRGAIHYGYGDILPGTKIEDTDAALSEIHRMGGSIVRVYVGNNKISAEEAARRLNEFLTKARKYDIEVIPSLIDFYNTGFNPQGTDLYYTTDWNGLKTLNDSFFNEGYKEQYLAFVKTVVNANKHHPNIFAWEPGNELKSDGSPSNFIDFLKTTSSAIKMIDPDHSITTGMINSSHAGLQPGQLYPQIPEIDIIGIHKYNSDQQGEVDIDWAHQNGRKAIVEEIGFSEGRYINGIAECNSNALQMYVSADPVKEGDVITFNLKGIQGSTHVEDSWSGGVNCNSSGFWGSLQCTATTKGTFNWTHNWKNCASGKCDFVSPQCSKQLTFTVGSESVLANSPSPIISSERADKLKHDLQYWRAKGVTAVLQWAFVPKSITINNGEVDGDYGMDMVIHNDYDLLFDTFKSFSNKTNIVITTPEPTIVNNPTAMPLPETSPTPNTTPQPIPFSTVSPLPWPTTPSTKPPVKDGESSETVFF